MSTAKITLRPPPNVEFVEGYPGIPPGAPDRPQAAVKGAIEVRLGPQGAKAKYVRVELRKIETLPSPPPNSFYSVVGSETPTVLWQASEEWGVLQTQDIPFTIRIPEAIPPSLSLEKGAGVKYELVGQVCVQGKTSFLRRSKPVVISTTQPIIIDKHEFHSTWQCYQKHESRQLMHDSVLLNVERNQNCYGPGDRVFVTATIRSDALHTVILRGFEFTLKETTVFTAGIQSGHHKKGQPQVKINIIGEQKIPVNATLYGGMQHRSELSVPIPDSHTTTTLNSAKHVDVTYVLIVKALMGTGKPLIMELPVIVSNWPRNVSQEAIRRIGFVPNLSGSQTKPQQPSTLPNRSNGSASSTGHGADEFGFNSSPPARAPATAPARGFGASNPSRRDSEFSTQSHSGRGFAIANAMDGEIPEEEDERPKTTQSSKSRNPNWPSAEDEKTKLYQQAKAKVDQVQGSAQRTERTDSLKSNKQQTTSTPPNGKPPASAPASSAWLSAEEEKARLYEQAKAKAERVQGLASAPASQQSYSRGHGRGGSKDSGTSFSKPSGQGVSAGAALYASALADQSKVASPAAWVPTPRSDSASPKPAPAGPASGVAGGSGQRYMSADEEKAMLRRYHEATHAVQRHQESHFGPSSDASATAPFGNGNAVAGSSSGPAGSSSGPDAYASPPPVAGPAPVSPPANDAPPAWAPGGEFEEGISEKERYRRAFEAREAAARGFGSPPPASAELSPPAPSGSAPYSDPEKERYRRAFEARDAFAQRNGTSPMSAEGSHDYMAPPPGPYDAPPAINGYTSPPPIDAYDSPPPVDNWDQPPPAGHVVGRAQPMPPAAGAARPMTAAEEKAMLRARYAQEDSGSSSSAPAPMAVPPPPPLAPRPPREYIQETRDEDLRLQRALVSPSIADTDLPLALPPTLGEDDTFGLRLRPSSPFTIGLDNIGASRPQSRATHGNGLMNGHSGLASPPPLPNKVQM